MAIFQSSARVGCCEKACYGFSTINLQLINLLDFLAGSMFITFAIYLYTKMGKENSTSESAWMCWSCGILGSLLLVVSFFSFCAIVHRGCRCLMWMSSHLALLLAALNLGAGIVALTLQSKFYSYLDKHGNEDGITDSDITVIKDWYTVIACVLMGSCILELVRFQISRGFHESAERIDGEFNALLMEDDLEWRKELQNNNSARTEKYRDLRSHYKTKYAHYGRSSDDRTTSL